MPPLSEHMRNRRWLKGIGERHMRISGRNIISVCIVILGLVLAAYPFISNYLYEYEQQEVTAGYDETVAEMSDEALKEARQKAEDYNSELLKSDMIITDPFGSRVVKNSDSNRKYEEIMNLYGDGIMGILEIPAIDIKLNIYHGASSEVLEKGVGHLENTSFPIGGRGSHSVLSAHTGLDDKKLFTDLELMEKDDVFYIRMLNEILAYRVDQIKTVEPENVEDFRMDREKDYVTLVTCTPYGVNSHRLLVRGVRIPYEEPEQDIQTRESESKWMRQYLRVILTGLVVLAVVMASYKIWRSRRN